MTAKEFAENAGIAGGSITDWKTGRSKPSVESLQKISKYTGTQLDWLTCNSEFRTKKEELNDYLDIEIRQVIWKTLERSYDDYIVPINLTEEDADELVEVLALISGKNSTSQTERSKRFKNFLNRFENEKKEKIKELIKILLDEIECLLGSHAKYYMLAKDLDSEKSNVFPVPINNKLYMCPVYGRIAAGVPNWAEQCMEGRLPLDPDMMNIHNPEECFFLRVSGESMNKVVKNGGYALIRKQEDVENGDIAVVLVNGYDATLKKFTRKNDMVVLEPMSDDSSFEIQIYDRTTQIKILGKYIGKFEMN